MKRLLAIFVCLCMFSLPVSADAQVQRGHRSIVQVPSTSVQRFGGDGLGRRQWTLYALGLDDAQRSMYYLFSLLLGLLIVGIGLPAIYALWFLRGRDVSVSKTPATLSEPPDEMPPGLVGTLIDERAEMRDILATMVDLARRGYMRIQTHNSFQFEQLKSDEAGLRSYERVLITQLFREQQTRLLESLRYQFYPVIPSIYEGMYREIVQAGYYLINPEETRRRWALFSLSAMLAIAVVCAVAAWLLWDDAALVIFPFIGAELVGLALLYASRHMPARTREGAEAAVRWRAFRRYLKNIDRHIRGIELSQAALLFERYLPYAIAFGFHDEFARHFDIIGTPPPAWYETPPQLSLARTVEPSGFQSLPALRASGAELARLESTLRTVSPAEPLLAPTRTPNNKIALSLRSMNNSLGQMLNVAAFVFASNPSKASTSRDNSKASFDWRDGLAGLKRARFGQNGSRRNR